MKNEIILSIISHLVTHKLIFLGTKLGESWVCSSRSTHWKFHGEKQWIWKLRLRVYISSLFSFFPIAFSATRTSPECQQRKIVTKWSVCHFHCTLSSSYTISRFSSSRPEFLLPSSFRSSYEITPLSLMHQFFQVLSCVTANNIWWRLLEGLWYANLNFIVLSD